MTLGKSWALDFHPSKLNFDELNKNRESDSDAQSSSSGKLKSDTTNSNHPSSVQLQPKSGIYKQSEKNLAENLKSVRHAPIKR